MDVKEFNDFNCSPSKTGSQIELIIQMLSFLVAIIGILGNILALIKLNKNWTSGNSRYIQLLRILTTNDLMGLMAFPVLAVVNNFDCRCYCVLEVLFRFFYINSGSIAVIMSIDRYIALNYPFHYHANFKGLSHRNAIIGLGLVTAVITYLPLVGFGVYFDERNGKCKFHDTDTEMLNNKAYTILLLIYGILMCIVIITCNIFVIRITFNNSWAGTSKSYKKYSSALPGSIPITPPTIEIQFSKLMAFLSLTFVVCWMPQVISLALSLKSIISRKENWFILISDYIVPLHLTFDPFIYVLRKENRSILWSALKCCVCRLRKPSSDDNQITI